MKQGEPQTQQRACSGLLGCGGIIHYTVNFICNKEPEGLELGSGVQGKVCLLVLTEIVLANVAGSHIRFLIRNLLKLPGFFPTEGIRRFWVRGRVNGSGFEVQWFFRV